jgi:hypothetical protein
MKKSYTETFLKASQIEPTEEKIKEVLPLWWYNLRGKKTGGLRLTDAGIEFVEQAAKIKSYQVDLPKEAAITPQILVWLDNYINSPYYLTKKYIKVLSERSAFELYLFSGDIKKYGMSKSLSKRMSQENQSSKT